MVCRSCCVKLCHRRSHDHHGRKLHHGLTFHRFPAWRQNEGRLISELTRRRRAAWVEAVGRSDITFSRVSASVTVCSRHFCSGRPAYEMLESHPDWIPSLHLGHLEPRPCPTQAHCKNSNPPLASQAAQKQEETAGGSRWLEAPAWTEVRALLQMQLQLISTKQQQERNHTSRRAAGPRTGPSFREFFTAALEASLQASIRSRAESRIHSSSSFSSSSFKIPSLEEEAVSFSVSSRRCVDCVRLQTRIQELEDMLSHLRADQTSTLSERGEEVEEVSEWAGPVSPGLDSVQDSDGGSSLLWIQKS